MSQIIPQINAKRDKSSAGRHARPRRDGQWGVRGAPREGGCGAGSGGTSGQRAQHRPWSPEPGARTDDDSRENEEVWAGDEAEVEKHRPRRRSWEAQGPASSWLKQGGQLQRRLGIRRPPAQKTLSSNTVCWI